MYPTVLQSHDNELKNRILTCIHSLRIVRVEGLQVRVAGGIATVCGRLRSTRDYDLCLQFCRRVPGVVRIVDELEVDPPFANQFRREPQTAGLSSRQNLVA